MKIGRWAALAAVLGLAAFWTWALFFASKESINRIEDRAWAERAESICADAREDREALADYRELADADAAMLAERADLVDLATDITTAALDEVVATQPTDAKGRELVPQWEADYRQYLADRRTYAERLRTSGENSTFSETAIDGIPISERIERFALDNEMEACAPPSDL